MVRDYFGELEEEEVCVPLPPPRFRNFEGQRFGKWVINKKVSNSNYLCQCDCGFIAVKSISMLTNLKTSQCKSCYKKSKEFYHFTNGGL